MFSYKDAPFYSDYFRSRPDFELIEEFKLSGEEGERNLYVGRIVVLHTVHPLEVRVEIPTTFPHRHLTFRTKSLSGYPHLIHTGKVKHGDWFCLNTPFAETAEEQLNQEVERLKEWIRRQMRSDLPAVIEDPDVRSGIALANAYDWENVSEMNWYRRDAMLTFVGEFAQDKSYFTETLGYLHCIQTPDERLYAVKEPSIGGYKLPYILVEKLPGNIDLLKNNLATLVQEYGWDEKTCKHLLPEFLPFDTWAKVDYQPIGKKKYTEAEALQKLQDVEVELQKEEPRLPVNKAGSIELALVPPGHKTILLEEIGATRKKVLEEHGYDGWSKFLRHYDEISEDDFGEEYACDVYNFKYHRFALGTWSQGKLEWFVVGTNRDSARYETVYYELEPQSIHIRKMVSLELGIIGTQSVDDKLFFGRGAFSKSLRTKKVAIVGLGAIGSMVAEALARGGVAQMGLWDSDVVEPGNICRSAYRLTDMGESKVKAIVEKIKSINPFVAADEIKGHGDWNSDINYAVYKNGSFYGDVNYNSQEQAIEEIRPYDLIIDCTGSNEMLHFLSYALPNAEILSLCITNHATHLLCLSSRDGNTFELRKAYLSRIEQDTKNFYVEGTGCYSPTFLATYCDIASMLNLAIRELDVAN